MDQDEKHQSDGERLFFPIGCFSGQTETDTQAHTQAHKREGDNNTSPMQANTSNPDHLFIKTKTALVKHHHRPAGELPPPMLLCPERIALKPRTPNPQNRQAAWDKNEYYRFACNPTPNHHWPACAHQPRSCFRPGRMKCLNFRSERQRQRTTKRENNGERRRRSSNDTLKGTIAKSHTEREKDAA